MADFDKRYVKWGALGASALVVLIVLGSFVSAYNGLVASSEHVEAQARQVDVAYQRAFRLVPQITQLAEQYLENERDLMVQVTALRAGLAAAEAGGLDAKEAYRQEMADVVMVMGLRAEAYPELQSAQLYQDLMAEVTNTENKIAMEKVRYNDRVQAYNASLRTCCMPRLAASIFAFEPKPYIGYEDRPTTTAWPGE